MPIYSVEAPNGKVYDIEAPDGVEQERLFAFAKRAYDEDQAKAAREAKKVEVPEIVPETGFIPSVKRGAMQLGSLLGDVAPAMAAKAIGKDEYAKKQMEEFQQTQEEIQKKYPSRVPSYTDIHGVGDAFDYIVESVGELIPSILPSLITGGAAGVMSRGAVEAAKLAAKEAAKKELMKDAVKAAVTSGAYGSQAETLAAIKSIAQQKGIEAAAKVAAKYELGGAMAGSAVQNIPDVFQNVYEAKEGNTTGSDLGVALAGGVFNSALDAITPYNILRKINKTGVAPEAIGAAWFKRLGKGTLEGFVTEGGTEALQEVTNAAAEKIVNEHKDFFTKENFERFINAGLKGGLGGGVATGVTDLALGKRPKKTDLEKEVQDTLGNIAPPSPDETLAEPAPPIVSASVKEMEEKIANLSKMNEPKVDEVKTPEAAKVDEVKTPEAAKVEEEPTKPIEIVGADYGALAPSGAAFLDAQDKTGGHPPAVSAKMLLEIAGENKVDFNPEVEGAIELANKLRAKLGEQNVGQSNVETDRVSDEVPGQQISEESAARAEASDGTGLDSAPAAPATTKRRASTKQPTLASLNETIEEEQARLDAAPRTQTDWNKKREVLKKEQSRIAAKLDKNAAAIENYVLAAGSPGMGLRLLAADLAWKAKMNEFNSGTGGKYAQRAYASLSPEQKQIVDSIVKKEFKPAVEKEAKFDKQRYDEEDYKFRITNEGQTQADMQGPLRGTSTREMIMKLVHGDIRGALKEIGANTSNKFNELEKLVANRLSQLGTLPAVHIVPEERIDGSRGRYVADNDVVYLGENSTDSHSLLHEVTHGGTLALIRAHLRGDINNKGVKDLNDLYNHIKENYPQLAGQRGMANLEEFASEAMSNPDFQNALRQIPYQSSNALTAFAKAVLRILGITPNGKFNALASALISVESALTEGRKFQTSTTQQGVAADLEGTEKPDVTGAKGAPKKEVSANEESTEEAIANLAKALEAKEGRPKLKKLFTTKEGWHWWVKKLQNSREVLKRITKSMGNKLKTYGPDRNDFEIQFTSSGAKAEMYYYNGLQFIYKDINNLAAQYAKATGQSFEDAMSALHLYAETLHAPERRHVLFLLNAPFIKTDEGKAAAGIRKDILKSVSELKGSEAEREAQAKQYRALLEQLVAKYKEPTANENDNAYNPIGRSAAATAKIQASFNTLPIYKDHKALLDKIMVQLQAANKMAAELNKTGHYWSMPVDNIVKFYDYKNYVPFKGRPDQESVQNIADPFSKKLAGELTEGQDAAQGRKSEAENIILRVMSEGVNAALRAGRKDLTLSIKNAVKQGHLKGVVNPANITGQEGRPVNFEDRFILGKSISELKNSTNIFHYNDDGSIDVIQLTDPEQREAIRRTFKDDHPFVDMMNSLTSLLGQMHTRYNPSFGPVNFVGDILTNAFTMGAEFGPSASFELIRTVATQVGKGGLFKAGKAARYYTQGRISELRELAKTDSFYESLLEYLDNGGKVSFVQGLGIKSQTDLAKKEMKRAGKVITKADVDEVIDVWTDMFEFASRAASYTVAKQKYLADNAKRVKAGEMTQAEANEDAKVRGMYYAKNLANFEQVGDWGKAAGALFMFFRPAATGAIRAIEALQPLMMKLTGQKLTPEEAVQAKNAAVMLTGLAGMGYAVYMMAYMLSDDDDEGRNRTATDDMDRWTRYARFALPKWMTGGRDDIIFQMRWGFGLGAFASAGAQVAGAIQGESTAKKALENILEVGMDSFLPLPISRIGITDNPAAWIMDTATPSAFRPFMEYVMNVDSLGREIYNNRQSRIGDAYTGGDNIPEVYKGAARMLFDVTAGAVDISPNTMYFFASNYIDGVSKLGSGAANLGMAVTGVKEFNPKTDTILFDSFFGSPSNFDARKYSEAEKEIKAMEKRLKTLEKDPDNYSKFVSENPEIPFLITMLNESANGDLKYLRQIANEFRADRNLSIKDRQELIKNIVNMQNLVKRRIIGNFEAVGFKP